MSGVRKMHFWKDWWKLIEIHQYYAVALTKIVLDNCLGWGHNTVLVMFL